MTTLNVPKSKMSELIARASDEARQLLKDGGNVTDAGSYATWTGDCERWDARTKAALEFAVADRDIPNEFHDAATGAVFRAVGQDDSETLGYRQEALQRGINTLRSIEERLEFFADPIQPAESRPPAPVGRQVFVVHGRDEGIRQQVARLLERLGLEPIILQEQTNRGRTIIEKFEDHALDVGYAVILLTPDDFGRGPDDADWPDEPNRARQNVILELGYFLGSLGRDRTAAIYVEGTDLPSDIHGLLFIPFDGNWELRLAKEMRDAGLVVDLNRM